MHIVLTEVSKLFSIFLSLDTVIFSIFVHYRNEKHGLVDNSTVKLAELGRRKRPATM